MLEISTQISLYLLERFAFSDSDEDEFLFLPLFLRLRKIN